MLTEEFNYDLPAELIAQEPLAVRSASRLMVIQRDSQKITHGRFQDLINYLNAGDCLVINETKVRPARIKGQKLTGAVVELLLLREEGEAVWEALCRPARRVNLGSQIIINEKLQAEVVEELTGGRRLIKFFTNKPCQADQLKQEIMQAAAIALPPYIQKPLNETNRYQTVYSREVGSVAAPTAGLHFTKAYLKKIEAKGIKITRLVLHISLDTFRPIVEKELEHHKMHSEEYFISQETAAAIKQTKQEGKKVVAVGTTVVRALESAACEGGQNGVQVGAKKTSLFIYPGYKFKVVDALLTNFHLPKSTLLILVSAFAGTRLIKQAYYEAIVKKYRFYSFGDAMLIL